MSGIRSRLKHALEATIVVGGAADWSRRRNASRTLVLAYHDIVPDGAAAGGDRSLHLPQRDFGAQLDSLLETHDVVPLPDALRGGHGHRRPRAVITFDDAYAGAMTAGIDELRARKLPATIFVSPSFLGGNAFWWDMYSDVANGLDSNFRSRALDEWRGITDDVVAGARASGVEPSVVPAHSRCATAAQLESAMTFSSLTLAAHTDRHPNLLRLTSSELQHELDKPLEWLQQFGDRGLPVISYPYGLADARVWNAAATSGYVAGCMIDGGWVPAAPSNPYALPRLNVPAGISRHGFDLRTAGILQS